MAISSGWGPHFAWLQTDVGTFPIEEGIVDQHAERKASTFSVELPMNLPGAYEALQNATTGSVIVSTRGDQETLISGNVKTIEYDLIDTKIRVGGQDSGSELHNTKSSEKWVNKHGSEIVQDLASRVGLQVQADASSLLAGKKVNIDYARVTDGISFAAVMHKLAELDGARWWVKNGTLYYRSSNSPSGTYTINYDPGPPIVCDALRLHIGINADASRPVTVNVASWHPKSKQVYKGTSSVGGNGKNLSYNFHIPNLLQDHVNGYAKSKLTEITRHARTLQAELVGDPSIDVAMGLQLTGTGIFDGLFEMDTISHHIGMGGHTMAITAKSQGNR